MKSFVALCVLAFCLPVNAFSQNVSIIATEGKVNAVTQTSSGSYVETERGNYLIYEGNCDGGVCLKPDVIRNLPKRAPQGGLPDGMIATAKTGDIRQAWYSKPTDRYVHCVLGDCLEGGSLVIKMANGKQKEFALPDSHVFEDITPRIHDFDNDGFNEVVTIRASHTGGAAVAIYTVRENQIIEVHSSTENGQANRWLNIAAIDDRTIVFIRTPHIDGRSYSLSYDMNGNWHEIDQSALGRFSNHVIGSRILDLSAVLNGQLYLPTQSRKKIVALKNPSAPILLPSQIDKALISLETLLITATENGDLISIKP